MTLRNFDENPLRRHVQPEIGTTDHWGLFLAFQGTPLHEMLVQRVQKFLNQEAIDSAIAGREVLRSLSSAEQALFTTVVEEHRGGLFGMVLWNVICLHYDDWLFVRQTGRVAGFPHNNYWRGR